MLQVVAVLGRERLVIGGKSMGGRIASLILLVRLAFPRQPPNNGCGWACRQWRGLRGDGIVNPSPAVRVSIVCNTT